MDTYVGVAWGMASMPVRIVGLVHTLSYRVGNQFMWFFHPYNLGVVRLHEVDFFFKINRFVPSDQRKEKCID